MRTTIALAVAAVAVVTVTTPHAQAPQSPAAPAPTAAAPTSAITPRPVGTMSQLMVDILYPASDALFYIATRTPATSEEWTALQGKALMVAEVGNLLMMPGRARDNDRWMADAKLMVDAFTAAYRAAKDKDVPAIEALNERLVASCTRCHVDYRPGYGRRP